MAADKSRFPVAQGWMLWGEWRAHPGRVLVAAIAVAIGVALAFAVHLVNQSALAEFGSAIRTVNGAADLQVKGKTPTGFAETLYPTLAHFPGVAAVSPVVELSATVDSQGLTLLGIDPLRAVRVTPSLLGRRDGEPGFAEDGLYLSSAMLQATGHRIGDRVTLAAGGRISDFTIIGGLPGVAPPARMGVIDIGVAQWRFGQIGRLQRLDLKFAPGISEDRIKDALTALLPPDAALESAASAAKRGDSLSRAYRVNLDMLAMVALLTGGFLVYSAQFLAVARRQTQFALLRVLGMRRRALLAQIIIEGAVVGMIGSLAGIGLGTALADLALRLLGADLGGGYFQGGRPALLFPPMVALILLALGVAVAVAGSLLPALAAGRAHPAVALKNAGDSGDPRRRPAILPGLILLLAGAVAGLGPPIGGLPLCGYLAIGLLLAGGVACMAPLARLLLGPLNRLGGSAVALDLAVKRLWGAPRQAAVALSGIVASTSLTIAMAVMVASFRGSVEDWLTQLLPAGVYLRIEHAESGGLDPELQGRLRGADGVSSIEFRKTFPMTLQTDQPAIAVIARPIDPAHPDKALPLIGPPQPVPPGQLAVWVSEPMAWLYHLHPGDSLVMPFIDPPARSVIAGVWRDYSRQYGALALDAEDYTRLTGDRRRTEAAIQLRAGAEPQRTIQALRALLPPALSPQTDIGEPSEIRQAALSLFDRSFTVTYALEAIAILVGLTGVAATLSAQTLARTKEFGMLRHIGVTRRQIILMLIIEGALLGGSGIIAGLGLGIAMSQILIHVVNPQSFHWTMETRLPWRLFALVSAAGVLAAAATALLAGRRALSADAVRAVREDW